MPENAATGHHRFFATCPRNTEGLLLQELRALGAADATETRAGVGSTGSLSLAYRVCLWSRVASRVLLRLASFPTSDLDDLYAALRGLPWEDHLGVSGTLAVEVTTIIRQGPLAQLNTHFAEQRVKDAVVDRFRAKTGRRPGVDLARPNIRINLHLTPAEAFVSLDLSGDGLHRRGYRLEGGDAPLKENLAAAILLRAGWPHIAREGGALLDPMCGSGTLLMEGALLAGDIAPGLLREYYGFLGWRGFDSTCWAGLLDEARNRRDEGLAHLPPVYGYDRDQRAIGAARANVRRAGLAGRVVLEQRELAALAPPATSTHRGLVLTNPPYGKRLGGSTELVGLYEALGERLKASFSGWEAAVFTGNPELSPHLGLRAHRLNTFYNGPIECKLLLFHIGERGGREIGGTTPGGTRLGAAPSAGALMFANRLRKNLKHLKRWATRENVHCYRAYDADLPEYAVAVDLYEDWAHVQEYAPPDTIDPVRARRRLKEVLVMVSEVMDIPEEHVILKVRRPQRGSDQYQKLRDKGAFVEVREGDLRFLVNLTDYLDTGLFLDHRQIRRLIRESAPGRRFLNLFAYTGSATVYAAAGGAASTTTVDLSPTYLEWAARNLDLNSLGGPKHQFVRADCLAWLSGTSGRGPYDLIFLDAPTFSNSKSMSDTLDIQRDHPQLIRQSVHLLSSGGILLFSTNFRHFKLDPALAQQYAVTDITRQTMPPDFARNPRIHTCYRITALASQSTPATRPRQSDGPPRSVGARQPDDSRPSTSSRDRGDSGR